MKSFVGGPPSTLSEEEIRALVDELGDLVGVLEAAEPQKKADFVRRLVRASPITRVTGTYW